MPRDLPKQPLSPVLSYRSTLSDHIRHQRALEAAAANSGTGYVYYQDTARDRTDAIAIAANVRTQVMIDGDGPGTLTKYADTIPRPANNKPLLVDGQMYPAQEGDAYLIRFGFSAAIVPPALDVTEDQNSILVEYDVGGTLIVEKERKPFTEDPGPARRNANDIGALAGLTTLALLPIASLFAPRRTEADARLARCMAQHGRLSDNPQSVGQKFTTKGQAFAGPPVVASGVRFFVTPTADIELWGADLFIARISSPTE